MKMQTVLLHAQQGKPIVSLNLLSKSGIFIHIPRVTVGPLQVKALSKIILCMPQGIGCRPMQTYLAKISLL